MHVIHFRELLKHQPIRQPTSCSALIPGVHRCENGHILFSTFLTSCTIVSSPPSRTNCLLAASGDTFRNEMGECYQGSSEQQPRNISVPTSWLIVIKIFGYFCGRSSSCERFQQTTWNRKHQKTIVPHNILPEHLTLAS